MIYSSALKDFEGYKYSGDVTNCIDRGNDNDYRCFIKKCRRETSCIMKIYSDRK